MREKIIEILYNVKPDVDYNLETKLIDDGVLESFDVIQVVTTIMDEFDVIIDADDIEPEYLNSVDNICRMVERKIAER